MSVSNPPSSPLPPQLIRQVLLDILGEYRELDFPANPQLLKLHIDVATDKLESYLTSEIERAETAARIDELNLLADAQEKVEDFDVTFSAQIYRESRLETLNQKGQS